jgi:hypothetical protein
MNQSCVISTFSYICPWSSKSKHLRWSQWPTDFQNSLALRALTNLVLVKPKTWRDDPITLSAKSITQIPAIYSLHWQPVPGQVTVSVSRFELILYREMEQRDTPPQYPIIYYDLQHLPWMFTLYQPSENRRWTWRRARGCCELVLCITVCVPLFLGKDIVFRFIIECSSLRDFCP